MSDEKESTPAVSVSEPKVETQEQPGWVTKQQLELEVRVKVREEYENLFKLWKDRELVELEAKQKDLITETLTTLTAKWKEDQRPPTHEELQHLLTQEYETFTLNVYCYDAETNNVKTEVFTIRELPQASERNFYNQFKTKILSKASAIQAMTQAGMDMPFEDKLKSVLELFDDSFDVLADAVVICLNPFNKRKDIDRSWVQSNIGSDRQWSIVQAQIGVNRLKDFFSKVSQSGQSMATTMNGVSIPQLPQLAR